MIIAIDGPAASGKSTIGGLLAERLGYVYFDEGRVPVLQKELHLLRLCVV